MRHRRSRAILRKQKAGMIFIIPAINFCALNG